MCDQKMVSIIRTPYGSCALPVNAPSTKSVAIRARAANSRGRSVSVLDEGQLNRYLCVAVDVRKYSSNDIWAQQALQAGLNDGLNGAAEDAGLDRLSWQKQESGDGELSLVPAGPTELRVMDAFVRHLLARIMRFNAPRERRHWLRVRLAFHNGWARRAALGYAGADVVAVARLVDSPQLRTAMDNPTAQLGIIMSESAFAIVRQGLTTLPLAEFGQVQVAVKEFTGPAWIWIPATEADRPRPSEPAPTGRSADAAAGGPSSPGNQGIVIMGGNNSGAFAAGDHAIARNVISPIQADEEAP
jgi:hypothetical protein